MNNCFTTPNPQTPAPVKPSSCEPPCLPEDEWKEFLLRSLNRSEACDGVFTRTQVDTLWDIFSCQAGCDCELAYLIVRAQMLKVAMGYYRSSIDFMTRRGGSHSTTSNSARQDGWASSQGTLQATRFSDAVSTMRYNDTAFGNAQSGSNATSWSNSYDDSVSDYRDTGAGASQADTEGNRNGGASTVQSSHSEATGSTDAGGQRGGCTYSIKQHRAGKRTEIGILNTRTANPSWSAWDRYSCNKAFSFQDDVRNGLSDRHVHGSSFSHTDSSRSSSSYFFAHVDQSASRVGASRSENHSTAFRDARAHSEGAGAGQGQTLGQSQQSQQSTATASDEGESHRKTDRNSFAVMDSAKAQQRFAHLLSLYDNTMELLAFKKRLRDANFPSFVGKIFFSREDGYCGRAEILAFQYACLNSCGASSLSFMNTALLESSKSFGAYVVNKVECDA